MAAAMNGIAVHGGVVPYGGTFLVFSDYARGAMRLSSVMGAGVIYVLTHDSIGLGEDGPTHQPVEHLAMLRATPNLNVFRPADTIETAEAWELALTNRDTPSVLALTRQNLPTVRTRHARQNLTRARRLRACRGRGAAAGDPASPPARRWRSRWRRAASCRARVSAPASSRCPAGSSSRRRTRSIAAACCLPGRSGWRSRRRCEFGWERWLCGERGSEKKAGFVGMTGFGASGPIEALYPHFGITAEAVAAKAEALL